MQSCRGCSGNAHVDVMNIDGELFSLSRPQEIPGSGRFTSFRHTRGYQKVCALML